MTPRMERFRKLVGVVPAEAARSGGKLLHQVTHDLNGPLSTFVMELYTLRADIDQLRSLMQQDCSATPDGVVDETLSMLAATVENLSRTTAETSEYVKFLEEMGAALGQTAAPTKAATS